MRKNKALLAIIILAALLRFYKLSDFPPGFNADEAAYGYNAYSLLKTGRDEFGNRWPLYFVSFGDYKPPLYTYLTVPFVAALDRTELAVRLPSALAGITTVFLIYFLTYEVFVNQRIAILSSLLLAISPWHLHFSRGAWETNLSTTLFLAGLLFFFKALKDTKFFIFSFLFLVFSMYAYHSSRFLVPFLGVCLVLLYRKKILAQKKKLVWPAILALVLSIPLIFIARSPAATARLEGLSVFSDQGVFWQINEARGEDSDPYSFSARIFHNKLIGYGRRFLGGYLNHFDLKFLFLSGDEVERSAVPEMGQAYLFLLPFFIWGLFSLLQSLTSEKVILALWFLASSIPAALTFQTPSALRAMAMVIPFTIVIALGWHRFLLFLKTAKKPFWAAGRFLFWLLLALSFVRYLHQYYVHIGKHFPESWEYGFRETVTYVSEIEKGYEQIIVTTKYDQPYILFAFYLGYPPKEFQQEAKLTPRDKFHFSTIEYFGKYRFRKIDYPQDKNLKNTLLVGADEEIPDEAPILKTVNFLNGKPAFQIVASQG
jgi:4-amino-4-deoxy-L-arabinose transferase-like glycosyltransferase